MNVEGSVAVLGGQVSAWASHAVRQRHVASPGYSHHKNPTRLAVITRLEFAVESDDCRNGKYVDDVDGTV